MNFRVLPMQQRHLPELAHLEQICFSDPWSADAFSYELVNPGARFRVAESEDGQLLGYLGLHFVLDEGYIANIATAPGARRMGVASALIEDAVAFGEEMGLSFLTLEVRMSNIPAQNLYRKYGFSEVGIRKNYYQEPREDALLMTRQLKREEVK